MRLSALLPHRPDFGERDYIWSLVRKRYEQLFPQIEICIGADNSNEQFCRSRGVNEAAKKATGDLFIIVDMDVVFNLAVIDQITMAVNEHPWIIPYSSGVRLTQKATTVFFEHELLKEINSEKYDAEGIDKPAGPLMNVMTRKCFEAIGGMDERFIGWGREDRAMVLALNTLFGKYHQLDNTIYHLWHQRPVVDPERYEKNNCIFMEYQAANGNVEEMRKVINRHKVQT